MKQSKKYTSQVTEAGSNWTAEIIRRVSARKTKTSTKKEGFSSEEEAKKWAEGQLEEFHSRQTKKNQRGRGGKKDS